MVRRRRRRRTRDNEEETRRSNERALNGFGHELNIKTTNPDQVERFIESFKRFDQSFGQYAENYNISWTISDLNLRSMMNGKYHQIMKDVLDLEDEKKVVSDVQQFAIAVSTIYEKSGNNIQRFFNRMRDLVEKAKEFRNELRADNNENNLWNAVKYYITQHQS